MKPFGIIVSRHPATIEWLHREVPQLNDAPVFASVTADDVRGKFVWGNVPLHLAALAAGVMVVEFTDGPPRGQEYGLAEMDAAGARLRSYTVSDDGETER